MVEISSKAYCNINGMKLYRTSSTVIHLFQSNTMLTKMARTTEVFANSIEIGGRGKPSAMMATDSSQRGSRLARVVSQECGSAQRASFTFSISFTLSISQDANVCKPVCELLLTAPYCQNRPSKLAVEDGLCVTFFILFHQERVDHRV